MCYLISTVAWRVPSLKLRSYNHLRFIDRSSVLFWSNVPFQKKHSFIGVSSELIRRAGRENRHPLWSWAPRNIGCFCPIQERLEQVGVELTRRCPHDLCCAGVRETGTVGSRGCKGIVDVSDTKDPGGERNRFTFQSVWVTGSIPPLVMEPVTQTD